MALDRKRMIPTNYEWLLKGAASMERSENTETENKKAFQKLLSIFEIDQPQPRSVGSYGNRDAIHRLATF